MNNRILDLCVGPNGSIRDALSRLDRGGQGIVLVVNEEFQLINTITDGDIRRAMLDHVGLDASVEELLKRKAKGPYPNPVTVKTGMERDALLRLMQERCIRQLPVLDEEGKVVELVTLPELLPRETLPMQAVIMAGGFGSRLFPLTADLPKPMLTVGDRPLMQTIIEQLRDAGIRRVNVATHYQPEKITTYFGDGQAFGVELTYVTEDRPLGTAGALSLLTDQTEPLLIINGDILTDVDFRAMLVYHREHKADITVAVRQFDVHLPYGVLECDGHRVRGLKEKPLVNFFVNAGIYLMEPSVQKFIPNEQRFDMTELIQNLIDEGRPIVSFPVLEYWLDIGQHDDYERAKADYKNGRLRV